MLSLVSSDGTSRQSVSITPSRHPEDLGIARRIQRSLLPTVTPLFHGFRVAAEYRPASEVGGDFYDVVVSGPGEITAVIGDVSGKGVAGALVMSHLEIGRAHV